MMFLSLPLPVDIKKNLSIIIHQAGNKPKKLNITFPRTASIFELTQEIAKLSQCAADALRLATWSEGRFHKLLFDSNKVSDINLAGETHLYAYVIQNYTTN
jgi:hypothetical protein